ncbi:MAG: hypothetical protein HDR03_05380 [Lachnospiraceae bacterium]|nr:hypothetical protein [Lachnospiraceae bacterium]
MIKEKKPFYSRWWFILIVIIVVVSAASSIKSGLKNVSDKKSTYSWPNTSLVNMIPQPDSKYGKIIMENESYFSIDVYKVSKELFEKYIEGCKNNGFTVDYTKFDTSYMANNEDGYSLSLFYNEKEKNLSVSLRAPEETSSEQEMEDIVSDKEKENIDTNTESESADNESINSESTDNGNTNNEELNESKKTEETNDSETKNETSQAETETSDKSSEDMRPEFKAFLDEYEKFMNEYCDFMKKYTTSDDITSMTMDYAKLLKEEIEWAEKIDKLENEEMNAAEAKYYAEITLRVSQKLLEVAQ